MSVLKSLSIFVLAGLCEIGGGYLIWQYIKAEKPIWYGIAGGFALSIYGIIATWQSASFGRVYASYGGIFVVLSLLWAWKIDHFTPDRYDLLGALIVLIGVSIIYYAPRPT
jgi:small multidrug resistance family-3 protein